MRFPDANRVLPRVVVHGYELNVLLGVLVEKYSGPAPLLQGLKKTLMRTACRLQDLDSLCQVIDSLFQSLDLISEAFDYSCIVVFTLASGICN